MIIEGLASPFYEPDLGGDIVLPGAFEETLKIRPIPLMLENHRIDDEIGIWTKAYETETGLMVRGKINANAVKDLHRFKGLSIGYRAERWKPRGDKGRLISKIALKEISLVFRPMAPKAKFVVYN